jgi:hypothetical protein
MRSAMGREPREVWAKRVERWTESGLTVAEFGVEIGVDPQRLTRWKWRLKAAKVAPPKELEAIAPKEAPAFVEVMTPPAPAKPRREPPEALENRPARWLANPRAGSIRQRRARA